MEKAFVISDIHGMYQDFLKVLTYWNRKDLLVILGDMIDRGPESLEVIQLVMKIKEHYGDKVIVLTGNHDQLLIDFINDPFEYGNNYQNNGGNDTIRSFTKDESIFYYSFAARANKLLENNASEIEFIRKLPRYHEFGKVLFTHAGFCSWRDCWEETTDEQFIWIRDHYKHKNNSGFVNVFGHTPTQLINKDKSNDVWISEDKLYIGIDGACAYGGQLNGILINEAGELLETYKSTDYVCNQK